MGAHSSRERDGCWKGIAYDVMQLDLQAFGVSIHPIYED
jgi:hypothetical protein